jgi:hypothetical protein
LNVRGPGAGAKPEPVVPIEKDIRIVMKYAYEDLSEGQFESLIVILCKRLLGISVQGFSQGPDGGRDAKFVGTAERHPSTAAPWVGITIVQAKHTNGYNRHFSETDFYNPSAKKSVLGDELPRIKALHDGKHLDHYMLFANRRLPGIAESEIRVYLSKGTGVPEASIYLCGIEQLEAFMKEFPDVAKIADLDPVDSPLIVSPTTFQTWYWPWASNGALSRRSSTTRPCRALSTRTRTS